ncbi:hypothetical protein [Bradyrhizobium japonicum]|uniref:hypothetical protein n=1 Tax=Bradyrhizobium japonicum TaxID=375 RepID=UPI0012BB6AC3|nr:hypothetical protein [Bradyrhizobium japonicum]
MVAAGTFLILCVVIFLTRPHYVVQSLLEIGFSTVDGRQDPIESPEQVARQIAGPYLSSAIVTVANSGASAPKPLQALRAEAIGRSITIQNTIPAELEKNAKELQQIILDKVIQDRAPFLKTLKERRKIRIESARHLLRALQEQRDLIERQVKNAGLLEIELRSESARIPADSSPQQQLQDRRQDRKLELPTASLVSLASVQFSLASLLIQTDKQIEDQLRTVSLIESEQAPETRILSPPALIPAPVGPNRLYLIVAALVVSALFGFGAAALMHNLYGSRP